MKIKALESEDTGHEILCDSFLITDISSFQELKDLYKEYTDTYEGSSVLLTLDDLGQAQYTSMHATMSQNLDDTEGYDLSEIDPRAFEDGEHIGCLTTKSEFFIREGNFERKVEGSSFTSACNRGLTIDEDEVALLEDIHKNPMSFLDKEVIVKIVPVEKSYLAISGFPNGYFTCDLNPFENYSIAKHFLEKYNYRLFGVGASLLGFIRENRLSDAESKLLEVDLAKLYNQDKAESSVIRLANLSKTNEFFFLKYVEYIEG